MFDAKKGILIVTQHQKEKVLGPVFKQYLGCEVFVKPFNTDLLGTFTGEVARLNDALMTCKNKAIQGAELANHPYAIASEGSFGPHPSIPFMPYAHELMVFVDLESDICIHEELMSPNTNYQTKLIDDKTSLDDFLKQVHFPSHALCLQTSKRDVVIAKGIQSYQVLLDMLKQGFAKDEQLLLSTDMRAMMNPTRMQVIGELGHKLALRILSRCPQCQTPGFGQKGVTGFLSCQQCHMPSATYAFELWGCIQCEYQEKKLRRDGKENINPQYCQFCNP